jgi:cysteine desulfurase
VLFPIEEAGRMARAAGVPLHVDAVQGAGKVPLDVQTLDCDFLSLSGHKFHAPKGVGLLYVRRGARFLPLLSGASQEGGRRAGTENVPGILGLAAAAAHMGANIPRRRAHLEELTGRIERRLLALPGTRRNGDADQRLPGTVNVSFAGIEGSAIVLTAAREGVCISAGSACSASQHEGSHVMEAMGVPFEYLYGAIRLSCAETTTPGEVETALDVIERAVAYLRSMTPDAPRDG